MLMTERCQLAFTCILIYTCVCENFSIKFFAIMFIHSTGICIALVLCRIASATQGKIHFNPSLKIEIEPKNILFLIFFTHIV